jgi:hypothetical protein
VILNKAMSLVVVASALPFRAAAVPFGVLGAHWTIGRQLDRCMVRCGWATKIASQTLDRVIAILLVAIAVVLLVGYDTAAHGAMLTGIAQALAGVIAGFAIGVVAPSWALPAVSS